ncbi:MAG: sulfite exporter TauE/SafE family protein [Rhodospirillales bacterium]|nr:sulfite exporter TauE/SafE family protein [Rhodospirillales bacterium]
MVAALLAAGIAAGLLAGLLGVGGGIVIVPVLFHLFSLLGFPEDVRMHIAVGTSFATIMPTSIISARAHARRGAVDQGLLWALGPPVFVGTLAGTVIAGSVRGDVLSGVFAVVALAVAANMAFGMEGRALRNGLPGGWRTWAIGGVIGGVSSMMGIGGGSLSVPVMSACRYPIRTAVGTAAAIGLIIAVPGALGFIATGWGTPGPGWGTPGLPPGSLGYVNLIGFALIVPATMLAAPWGARVAHAIKPQLLRRAFAAFLCLTSLRMIYGLLS